MTTNVAVHTWAAELQTPGFVDKLSVLNGSSALDQGWSPYAQASITIEAPAQAVQDRLDPRKSPMPRVKLTATAAPLMGSVRATSRTFMLQVRERHIDRVRNTIDLTLTSDEASLLDYRWSSLTPNTGAAAYQSSLRAIINNIVLAPIGAALQPGAADVPFVPLTNFTMRTENPRPTRDLQKWQASPGTTGAVALSRLNANAPADTGSWYARATVTGAISFGGQANVRNDTTAITVGKRYHIEWKFRASPALTYIQPRWAGLNAAGTATTGDVLGAVVACLAGQWTVLSIDTPAIPANTATLAVISQSHPDTGVWPTGATFDMTDVQVYEITTPATAPGGFFDGDTLDTTDYGYNWTGTQGLSTSTRTALVSRPPELLTWEPGETAWDFVTPLVSSAGFRLFCDEQRLWRLVDGGYIVEGLVTVAAGFNASQGAEDISRNDDSWADSVIVKYSWLDSTGAEQTAFDVASAAAWSRAKLIEYDRPYPGPGAAKYLLGRAQAQGRVMDVAAISAFDAAPNMAVSVTMPDSEIQTGYVSSVQWDLTADEMRIGTRGLTDTPKSAWSLIPVGERWQDSPAGASWIAEAI